MPSFLPTFSGPAAQRRYDFFLRQWQAHQQLWRRYATPPWWAPGVKITTEMRCQYERYLPIADYLHALAVVAVQLLPHPSWLPLALKNPRQAGPPSLPDLWAQLPDNLAGQLLLPLPLFPVLLTALADPARFGTNSGRYPRQLAALQARFANPPAPPGVPPTLRVLDLACGTGHGTWELANALHREDRATSVVGVSSEPLEIWMAKHQTLPHAPQRTAELRALAARDLGNVHFIAGSAWQPPVQGRFDLICCNGFIGGSFCSSPAALHRLFKSIAAMLAPRGWLACAGRFHAGHLPQLRAAQQIAAQFGLRVHGQSHDFIACK